VNGGCRGTIHPAGIKQRSAHTIQIRRRSPRSPSQPREGGALLTDSITAERLPPNHRFREQAIHGTVYAAATTGAVVAAIRLRGTRWMLELVDRLGHFGPAARPCLFLLDHTATHTLGELWRVTGTAGSPVREPRLADEQEDEQPAEHAFIVRRGGAPGKRKLNGRSAG
jgi:hypothetical protein